MSLPPIRLTQRPRHTGQQSVAQTRLSTLAHLEVTVYGGEFYDDLCGRGFPALLTLPWVIERV